MRTRLVNGKGLGILLIALTILLLIAACAPASEGQLDEEKKVSIGWLVGLTGPAASAGRYPHMVLVDYIKYANEEELIPGVPIDLVWTDTRNEVAMDISAYRKFADRGVPIMISMCESEVFKNWLEKDEVPMLSMVLSEAAIYPPGWIYSAYPTWAEEFAVWCEWIMENWEEDRPPRVARMGPDILAGPHALEPAVDYAENIGIEMLPSEYVPYVPLDVSTQLLRLKQRGADYVYISPIWTVAVPILKDAQRLGLMDRMNFGGSENTQSEGMIKAAGAAAEGYTVPRAVPWWGESEFPGIEMMKDSRKRYGAEYDFQGDDVHGVVFGAIAVEALKRAIEEVGYENLDGHAVKRALDSIVDFDVYGLKNITYTPEDRRGSIKVRIYQVQDGKPVPVSDWQDAPMILP